MNTSFNECCDNRCLQPCHIKHEDVKQPPVKPEKCDRMFDILNYYLHMRRYVIKTLHEDDDIPNGNYIITDNKYICNLMCCDKVAINKDYINHGIGYHDRTLLHYFRGDTDFVKFLIDNGADIDRPDDRGYTPLMNAVIDNDIDGVNILLKFNPNLEIVDNEGITPLKKACEKHYDNIIDILRKY